MNQLRVIMNNHDDGYLQTMALFIIFQAIDVVTVHSIRPIMYKHKSVDGCITPFNHMQLMHAVFSTNEQVVVHLWTIDTAAHSAYLRLPPNEFTS